MKSNQDLYDELASYTLIHPDPAFIHQHIVDAFAAQTADEQIKPIKILFALVGLYLHIEKNYSGREVQLAHMRLGKKKMAWPRFELPEKRGSITISDVLKSAPGEERDREIHDWCVSVWDAYVACHREVKTFLDKQKIM
jgi:hypothetical protein